MQISADSSTKITSSFQLFKLLVVYELQNGKCVISHLKIALNLLLNCVNVAVCLASLLN